MTDLKREDVARVLANTGARWHRFDREAPGKSDARSRAVRDRTVRSIANRFDVADEFESALKALEAKHDPR